MLNIVKDKEFVAFFNKQLFEMLLFLIKKQQEFSVICYIKNIIFTPDIPKEIKDNFSQTSLFILSGYSLQSAFLKNNMLVFEAGFGDKNISSNVSIYIHDILQIIIDDSLVFINPSAGVKLEDKTTKKVTLKLSEDDLKKSMKALLRNMDIKNETDI